MLGELRACTAPAPAGPVSLHQHSVGERGGNPRLDAPASPAERPTSAPAEREVTSAFHGVSEARRLPSRRGDRGAPSNLTRRVTTTGEELVVEEHLGLVGLAPRAPIQVAELDADHQVRPAEPMTTKVDPLPPVLDDNLELQGNGTWLDLAQNASPRTSGRRRCPPPRSRPVSSPQRRHPPGAPARGDRRGRARCGARRERAHRAQAAALGRRSTACPHRWAGAALSAEHAAFLEELIWTKRQHRRRVDPASGGPTQQDLNDPPAEDPLSLLREMDTTGGPLAVWASTPHASAPPRPASDARPRMLVKDLSRQLPPTAADEGPHNPKVAGSNPAPATKDAGQGPSRREGLAVCGVFYRGLYRVEAGRGSRRRAKVLAASACIPGRTCW